MVLGALQVVYVLPAAARAAVLSKSTAESATYARRRAWRIFNVVLRVAFGLALIFSILLALLAIVAVLIIYISQGGRSDSDSGPLLPFSGGGGGCVNFARHKMPIQRQLQCCTLPTRRPHDASGSAARSTSACAGPSGAAFRLLSARFPFSPSKSAGEAAVGVGVVAARTIATRSLTSISTS